MSLYAKIDCGLTRDPRMVSVGPLPRLLYVQSVLYCRENLTDGFVNRVLLPLVAVDIPSPSKHMARLVDVGAVVESDDGWTIPAEVWCKWNPLRTEVEAIRQAETDRKKSYRDKRRTPTPVPEMSQRDTASPRRYATDSQSQSDSQRESITTTPPITLCEQPEARPRGRFDEWWGLYPHRVGKDDARKRYQQHIRDHTAHGVLVANTMAWVRYWTATARPPDKVPYPGTFLNRGDWRSAPEQPTAAPPKVSRNHDLITRTLNGGTTGNGHRPPAIDTRSTTA